MANARLGQAEAIGPGTVQSLIAGVGALSYCTGGADA